MSYGLYDGDLKLYPRNPIFNLELMKISNYYKLKREIVNFSPNFKPEMYTHFIIRQDYPSRQPYSTKYNNLVFGGRAFDGDIYRPLPLDIELSKPDVSLYNKIENKIATSNILQIAFSTMRRAEHIRLSLDGKSINPQWYKQLRNDRKAFGIILHDYNLGDIEGAPQLIQDNLSEIISSKLGRRVGMKFPVIISNEEQFIQWLQLLPLNQYYSLQYAGILSNNYLPELKQYKNSLKQTSLNITQNSDYNYFITTGINQLFKLILDLRRYCITLPLIYDKAFFIDNRWIEVLNLFDTFISHIKYNLQDEYYCTYKVPNETLYGYAKKGIEQSKRHKPILTKEQVINVFQFVREHNYELFKMFYEYTGELK